MSTCEIMVTDSCLQSSCYLGFEVVCWRGTKLLRAGGRWQFGGREAGKALGLVSFRSSRKGATKSSRTACTPTWGRGFDVCAAGLARCEQFSKGHASVPLGTLQTVAQRSHTGTVYV